MNEENIIEVDSLPSFGARFKEVLLLLWQAVSLIFSRWKFFVPFIVICYLFFYIIRIPINNLGYYFDASKVNIWALVAGKEFINFIPYIFLNYLLFKSILKGFIAKSDRNADCKVFTKFIGISLVTFLFFFLSQGALFFGILLSVEESLANVLSFILAPVIFFVTYFVFLIWYEIILFCAILNQDTISKAVRNCKLLTKGYIIIICLVLMVLYLLYYIPMYYFMMNINNFSLYVYVEAIRFLMFNALFVINFNFLYLFYKKHKHKVKLVSNKEAQQSE